MEEEWAKASELLGPRLQKIATESSALESSYRSFASRCLAPDAAGGADWLSALRTAPVMGGIQFDDPGGSIDCSSARARLLTRAGTVKSAFNAAEDLARTSSVLPGHWRKLVESHQLDVWDRF
jgi:hypothetical protein